MCAHVFTLCMCVFADVSTCTSQSAPQSNRRWWSFQRSDLSASFLSSRSRCARQHCALKASAKTQQHFFSKTVWQLKQIYIWKYNLIYTSNLVFKIFLRKIGGHCCSAIQPTAEWLKNNRNQNSWASSQCYFFAKLLLCNVTDALLSRAQRQFLLMCNKMQLLKQACVYSAPGTNGSPPVKMWRLACTAKKNFTSLVLYQPSTFVWTCFEKKVKKGTRVKAEHTHREVFAVEFEVLPHADEQVEAEVVEQQMNGHVPLPAGLQEVTQQLHVTEAVHHYGQGLHRQVLLTVPLSPPCFTCTRVW